MDFYIRKPRHYPNKIQNSYGNNYDCPNYDIIMEKEFCHNEGNNLLGESIEWSKTINGKLICKGNRHNCIRFKIKWFK